MNYVYNNRLYKHLNKYNVHVLDMGGSRQIELFITIHYHLLPALKSRREPQVALYLCY